MQVLVMVLLSDFDIRTKEHETQIWGPQIAGHTGVAKVRDSCLVIVVGMANRRDRKMAMVILTSKVQVKLHGTLAEAMVLCKDWATQADTFVEAKGRYKDWVQALCTWAVETLHGTCCFDLSEEPVRSQV